MKSSATWATWAQILLTTKAPKVAYCSTSTTQRREDAEHSKMVYDSLDTLSHKRGIEVDEQPQAFIEQLEV